MQTAEERSAESRKRAEREGSVIEIDDEEPVPRVTPRKKAKKRRGTWANRNHWSNFFCLRKS